MAEVADLLILQQKLRQCDSRTKLGHLLVNETSKITPFDTAVFWHEYTGKAEAVSNLPEPVVHTPFTDWMNRFGKTLHHKGERNPSRLDVDLLEHGHKERCEEFLGPHLVWCPLTTVNRVVGGLLLSRQDPWKDEELAILGYWGLAAGHAVEALWNKEHLVEPWWHRLTKDKRVLWGVLALLVFFLLIPVDLSVNAAAEVVPSNPDIVRAPIEGIIGEVKVEPNQLVRAGDLILQFDDTAIRSQLDVAGQELAIARAEYQRANQGAVSDRRIAADLPMLKARVGQSEAKVQYNESLLERSRVYAEFDAVAVIPDAQELEGRPVKIGEKILTLARPEEVELEFWLAVGDSIPLPERAPVELFLNVRPDKIYRASVRYSSYQATVSPEGILAFKGRAEFLDSDGLRVGWRGTARISGESVFLGYYIFRRPLSALRQWTGF